MLVYVMPPITDERILSNTQIPSEYISNEISISGCPGEYISASFIIRPDNNLESLMIYSGDIVGANVIIPNSNIDVKIVKVWHQAGFPYIWDTTHKQLTPELLLNDDSLVRVDGQQDYLKLQDDREVLITDPAGIPGIPMHPTIEEMPVKDAETLQPVNIAANINKQFWITVKIPIGTLAGIYSSTIELELNQDIIGTITLTLTVLDIELSEPYLVYGLYYIGHIADPPKISYAMKNSEQIQTEITDMVRHGCTSPAILDTISNLGTVLDMRLASGMLGDELYYHGTEYHPYDLSRIPEIIAIANSRGFTDVYFYISDEPPSSELATQRARAEEVHSYGGLVMIGLSSANLTVAQINSMADVVDIGVIYAPNLDSTIAEAYHTYGHRVFSYSNPQCGEETPETYRRNYGLWLWQKGWDGAYPFAYQWTNNANCWNDFQGDRQRNHIFAYPTMEGVIDTREWEGWREGVDDIRYLTTLLETIEVSNKDTTIAEAWLADLKNSDLTTKNLDTVRSEMIDHILLLKREETTMEVTFTGAVDKQAEVGEEVTIEVTKPDSSVEEVFTYTQADKTFLKPYSNSPGNYRAKARIEEDALYQSAESNEISFSIGKEPRTITLNV